MAVAAKPSRSSNLLKFTKTVRHGFPDKPSCMAYDCVQELFAFGSQSGEVVVLGHPGLETRFMAPASTQLIQFSINKGIIATYCSDHVCYFWSIQSSTPHLIGEFRLPPKESALVLYWPYNSNIVYIGTGNGNVLFVAVQVELVAGLMTSARVLLCEETVYWNKVVIPSQGFRRDHPGEIKSIEEHPLEANKILIAYSHGLCIIWNLSDKKVEYRQLHSTVECASWYGGSGKTYVLCTTEGQIRIVTLNSKKKEDKILYECPGVGSITNFQSYNTKELKWLLFIQCTFSNNIYQSRIIILGEKTTLTSLTVDDSIVDILCIPTKPFKAERQTPKALVVLQNSKLDVFDLQDNISADSKLCPFSIPFSFDHMKSSSWITFLHHGGECLSQNTIDKLTVLKAKLRVNRFHEGISSNKWPFQGGGGWRKNKRNEDHLPLLLVTSHSDKRDSITLWLYYADILEYLFTIETAKLFPLVYSISSTSSSAASKGISSPKVTNPSGARNSPDEEQTNTEDSLDVKFVSVDMKRETMVFVNHRGNVLVYKFSQLQPDHERPNSTEILLNGDDEIDSPDDIASMLPWKFWASNERDTSQIHLLYHVCCVVNWEDSVKIVPVNSAVYNDEINMLLLGTHIAMVLTDMNSKGTIVIDTIKGLKSLGLSSVSTCEKRTVVESKKKSGFSKMFKRSPEVTSPTAVKPAQHEVTPLCASITDIVYFTTSITEQPSQTVWLGTESGDLGIYSVIRSPEKRIMIKSIGITLHLKRAIANLIFLTEHFQIIHTNTKWHCSLPDPTATPTCERILNYVIVQTRKSLECHGFPAKSSTVFKNQNPVAKYTEIDKDILNSFSTKLKDKPFLLVLIEGGNILLLSLPNLSPVTTLNVANDIKPSDFVTLSFNECGYGVYSIRPTEIQRVMISMTDTPMEGKSTDTQEGIKDTDGPGPSTYVPVTAPTKPNSGGRNIFKLKTTDDVQQNRNDWFTPQRPRYGDKGFSRSLPSINQQQLATTELPSPSTSSGTRKQVGAKSRYQPSAKSTKVTSQSTSPFERTAQALDERGKRLNKTVETTSKLLQLAEAYAENS